MSELSERFARILRMLIDAKCEIDGTDWSFGMTALDMAILNGDVESSAVLASAGGDPDHLMKMFALSDLYEVLVGAQRKGLKVRRGQGVGVDGGSGCIVKNVKGVCSGRNWSSWSPMCDFLDVAASVLELFHCFISTSLPTVVISFPFRSLMFDLRSSIVLFCFPYFLSHFHLCL